MKKFLVPFVASFMLVVGSGSGSASAFNEEVIPEDIMSADLIDENAELIVETLDESKARVFVGKSLFSMTASSISAGKMLTTGSSKVAKKGDFKTNKIGITSTVNGKHKTGLAYVNLNNSYVDCGSLTLTKTGSGIATFKPSSSFSNYYGFIRSQESSKTISGKVSFTAM